MLEPKERNGGYYIRCMREYRYRKYQEEREGETRSMAAPQTGMNQTDRSHTYVNVYIVGTYTRIYILYIF